MRRSKLLLPLLVLVVLPGFAADVTAAAGSAEAAQESASPFPDTLVVLMTEPEAEGEPPPPSVWDTLERFQSVLIALIVAPLVGFMTRWLGKAKGRQEAVTAQRVQILDELGPHFVHFIVQLRFLALDGIEGRLDSDLGREHRAEYDDFAQNFHADTEILMLRTEQYFGRGSAYADRLEEMARWCARLDGVVTRLAEGENSGSADDWREVRDLASQLRPVYRELLEQMSHEVTEGKPVSRGARTALDEARLDAICERVTESG